MKCDVSSCVKTDSPTVPADSVTEKLHVHAKLAEYLRTCINKHHSKKNKGAAQREIADSICRNCDCGVCTDYDRHARLVLYF